MPNKELLRAGIARGLDKAAQGVDRNFKHEKGKGAIFGYGVITKGQLNDQDIRDLEMDDMSLDQVVELGNKSKIGLKSRFGHPNMSGEALGTFLGRAQNFRRDKDIVRADLLIDETAYKTPNGDLATYVMDLAETDPEAFGSSLVFDADFEYRLEKDGTRKKDAQGKELPALVRFTKLYASDVVDDPAATQGMFGKFFNSSVELSAKATEFLDKFLNNPDAVEKALMFLTRYTRNRVDIDDDQNNKPQKEGRIMEDALKTLTKEQLQEARPDLCTTLQSEASQAASKNERERVLTIVKAEHAEFKDMGMEALSEKAIDEGHTVDAALASMRAKRVKDLEASANPGPGPDSDLTHAPDSHLEKARAYAAEHKCSMTKALSATAPKRTKENKR